MRGADDLGMFAKAEVIRFVSTALGFYARIVLSQSVRRQDVLIPAINLILSSKFTDFPRPL